MSTEPGGSFPIPYGYNARRQTFPSYVDNRHLCTIGPTRTGKGATVIVQALLRVPHSVVVMDPKGQNAAATARWRRAMGQDVYVLNPFGLHTGEPWNLGRHRFNPLSSLRIRGPNVAAEAAALAHALILTQGREPYFDDTARDFIKATILHYSAKLGPQATLAHVRKAITAIASRSKEGLSLLGEMLSSPHRFVSQPIGRFVDPEARDISSAINTAITQTAFLDDPALTDPARHGTLTGNDFNLAQLKRRPTTIYVVLPGQFMESYARFLRVLLTSAIDAVTSEPGGHPVLMVLDEFARLENLPVVTAAFGFAAGFNLQLWPFVQNIGQLRQVYGKEWSTLLANCGMVQFFTPADLDTAEYIQRRGGMTTGETRSTSYKGRVWKRPQGESRSETRVPLLPLERIMSLPPDQSLVFFAGKHNPYLASRAPYWTIPRLERQFDPDPYHFKA